MAWVIGFLSFPLITIVSLYILEQVLRIYTMRLKRKKEKTRESEGTDVHPE
jgi:hypothetical protein